MKLSDLIKGVEINSMTGDMNAEITGVACDSRKVVPGKLFVAVRGLKTDGHLYLKDAIAKGAATLLIEEGYNAMESFPIPVVTVSDSRKAIARVAVNYYGAPSTRLNLIGVTGTNGKTTTTYLIKSIFEGLNRKVGLIGTVSYSNGNRVLEASHTTPEALEFQGLLRGMADNGCEYAVAEVSSHALALKRVYGTDFRTAVFTNLTQDHLDFHEDMEDYFRAKALLFSDLSPRNRAVINVDDPYGKRLTGMTKCSLYTYGLNSNADLSGKNVNLNMDGLEFDAITPAGQVHIKSGLVGIYNVYNVLAAIGAALSFKVPLEKIASGIASVTSVPGRFEKIESGLGFGIVVDYAHTENALRLLLEAAKGFALRRTIAVFGCGGDRDKGKRPLMGKAAMELSDYVIVTSDNPRTEDPRKIIEGIEAGIKEAMNTMNTSSKRAAGYRLIPDRRSAIEEAIHVAEEGDLVVIAGKGHECYQIIGCEKFHFDDREEAREAIRKRRET